MRTRGKVTADQKKEIRDLYATGNWRMLDLALKFGISVAYVGIITKKPEQETLRDALDKLTKRVAALEADVA